VKEHNQSRRSEGQFFGNTTSKLIKHINCSVAFFVEYSLSDKKKDGPGYEIFTWRHISKRERLYKKSTDQISTDKKM